MAADNRSTGLGNPRFHLTKVLFLFFARYARLRPSGQRRILTALMANTETMVKPATKAKAILISTGLFPLVCSFIAVPSDFKHDDDTINVRGRIAVSTTLARERLCGYLLVRGSATRTAAKDLSGILLN